MRRKTRNVRRRKKKLMKSNGELSGLHMDVKEWLKMNGLYNGFKSEQQIGRYKVDEVDENKKIIIEINGDHWHANPDLYEADNIIGGTGGKTANDIWIKDKKRKKVLKESGYVVFIIWEQHFRSKRMRKRLIKRLRKVLEYDEQNKF